MAPTYDAIAAWVKESGHAYAGGSWEIYGDWHEDPEKLEVEICFLVA
jgi:effector-binding domain-containing protein